LIVYTANYPEDFRQAYLNLRMTTNWGAGF
jgi:hypothetical protein